MVDYAISYYIQNVTPFSQLSKVDYSQERIQKVKFLLYDDGWRFKILDYVSKIAH